VTDDAPDIADVLARATAVHERSLELLDVVRDGMRNSRSPVSLQRESANSKLAPIKVDIAKSGRERFVPIGPFVTSTYVSIEATCPDFCPYKGNGCYASEGASHLTMSGLNRAAWNMTALQVTLAEAAAIDAVFPRRIPQDGAKGGRDLRLHVGGEVSCTAGARALAGAGERWKARGGGAIWTFTKRWRQIDRDVWGPISVLASCVGSAEVEDAHRRGYAAAVVVPEFRDGPKSFSYGGRRAVPCPAEATEGVTCSSCRLCMDANRLRERGLVIAFAAHGAGAEKVRARLPVVR
jgi:hypothetical protein